MIRRATPDDLSRVLDLGDEFLSYGPYSWIPLDRDAFSVFALSMMEHGVIFLAPDGMIGGCLNPAYFNPAVTLAAELFWYSPNHGRALREALEAWARERGCVGITFSGLANQREATVRKLYERAGYTATEIAFLKRF